jgi:hypothetical protein
MLDHGHTAISTWFDHIAPMSDSRFWHMATMLRQ